MLLVILGAFGVLAVKMSFCYCPSLGMGTLETGVLRGRLLLEALLDAEGIVATGWGVLKSLSLT